MNQIFLYYFIKKDKKLNQLRGCPGSSCGTTVENTPRGREDVSSNHAGSGAFYNPTLSPFSGASLNRSHAEVQPYWFSFQLCLSSLKRSKLWYGLSKKDLRGCQSWKARLGKVMTRSFPEFEPRWDSFAFPFIPNQFRFKRKKMFGRKISFSDEREVFPSSWRLFQKFSFFDWQEKNLFRLFQTFLLKILNK